ncbi:hypothetical protein DZF91_09875 [Actinomadura logoneensis]|uniref:Uncharacterized protein n=1 Tax=Actinomadura logoneensis TaxID=2293572 RepID=A0A372JPR6_9ACTN|nr:DUF6493 family protein [Actinomadura logoneensis]RFU41806.1 hypothetical protein DZF91_09875 [Actinomadura logoneensis]
MNQAVREAITAGQGRTALRRIRDLDAAGRREVGKELPALLRELRDRATYGVIDQPVLDALLLAGLASIPGPAAAAQWLARSELMGWILRWRPPGGGAPAPAPALEEAVADRPDEWVAEVVRRAAGRVRDNWRYEGLYTAVAALVPRAGGTPPTDDAFVLGWTRWAPDLPWALARDPFAATLVPRLFEVDGAGGADWVEPVAAFVASGRLDRADALDRCVRRLLRGGRAQDLRWFCALHDELAPTPEESAARLRDFVRMLPAAPGPAADLALREIRRVDEASPVPVAVFAEAVEAALFRPEKRLVRSALAWTGRTARRAGRTDAAVRAVLPLLEAEDLAVRDRAVKIVARHAREASAGTREAAAVAGAALPAELRALIPGADLVDGPGPVEPAALPAYVPPPATPPIGSVAELVEATLLLVESGWGGLERVMAAIVEHAHRDPEGVHEALSQLEAARPWLFGPDHDAHRDDRPLGLVGQAVRGITRVEPATRGARSLVKAMRTRVRQLSRAAADPWQDPNDLLAPPFRLLAWRMREAVDGLGWRPFLLAVPTEANGLLDPAVLVERALRYEADGLAIGRADLAQALLRAAPEVDRDTLKRAAELTSAQGRILAEHLAADAPPAPEITVAPVSVRHRLHSLSPSRERSLRLLPTSAPTTMSPGFRDVAPLFALPRSGSWDVLPKLGFWPGYEEIPRMMPTHRELAAAHLLPAASGLPRVDDASWSTPEIGDAVVSLAEADGPAGPATAAVLAYAASAQESATRATALEGLLVLASRGRLPAADLGRTIATLVDTGGVKLTRIVGVLGEAVHAGAHAEVWETAREALPPLLTATATRRTADAPRGLADLLQLAARCAESVGARADLPGLADVAARGGSSALVREAARLQRIASPKP